MNKKEIPIFHIDIEEDSIGAKFNIPPTFFTFKESLRILKSFEYTFKKIFELRYGEAVLKEFEEKWKKMDEYFSSELKECKTEDEIASGNAYNRSLIVYFDTFGFGFLDTTKWVDNKCKNCGYVYKYPKTIKTSSEAVICPKCFTKDVISLIQTTNWQATCPNCKHQFSFMKNLQGKTKVVCPSCRKEGLI